jgi:hypothetical protein
LPGAQERRIKSFIAAYKADDATVDDSSAAANGKSENGVSASQPVEQQNLFKVFL